VKTTLRLLVAFAQPQVGTVDSLRQQIPLHP
jgi:hypothetical protein